MPTIHCRNTRLDAAQESKPCARVLARITPGVERFLRETTGEAILVRCASCPPVMKWIEIVNMDGELTFRSVETPNLDAELEFDNIQAGELVP